MDGNFSQREVFIESELSFDRAATEIHYFMFIISPESIAFAAIRIKNCKSNDKYAFGSSTKNKLNENNIGIT